MSFDCLAPHYDWMETLLAGPRLQRARLTWLEALCGRKNILVVGVGHGPSLPELARRLPDTYFTCVDASAAMLARAERRVRETGVRPERFTFIHATLPDWAPPGGRFDAVVTDFFLDCFTPEQLHDVIARLARAGSADAVWLVTDFAIPSAGVARWRARFAHWLMYGFFRVATRLPARRLTEPDALLHAAGFRLHGRRASEWGLLRADCWTRGCPQPVFAAVDATASADNRLSSPVSVASSLAFSREEKCVAMPSR